MKIQIPKSKSCLDFGLFIFPIKTGLDMSGLLKIDEHFDAVLIVLVTAREK